MRCEACNVALSDFEATRKTLDGEFLDLCNKCYEDISNEVFTTSRSDLMEAQDVNE